MKSTNDIKSVSAKELSVDEKIRSLSELDKAYLCGYMDRALRYYREKDEHIESDGAEKVPKTD